MNERFRIYAAVGLAGVLVLVGGFLVLGRGSASSAAPRQIKPLHPIAKHTRARAKQALASPKVALAKAKAGAAAAGAGFVTIDVANNAQVEALSALVGSSADPQNRLLDDPAVLVFQKPQTLYVRLNGYMDADTVGQAVVNAAMPAANR
jgi:hypothetical protein